jgi:phosphoglycolate phosphatase-like HAD superfamily hydrolase
MKIYPIVGISKTKLNKGFENFRQYVYAKNCELFIISSKSEHNLELSLKHLNISRIKYFGGLDSNGKANMIEELQLHIYIGDQPSDAFAAIKGGAVPIYYGVSRNWKEYNFQINAIDFDDLILKLKVDFFNTEKSTYPLA